MNGCFHHTWRFRDFCRKLLKTLAKDATYKKQLEALKSELNSKKWNI